MRTLGINAVYHDSAACLVEDGRVALLPSLRPAADNLSAIIPVAGRFLVVAPR